MLLIYFYILVISLYDAYKQTLICCAAAARVDPYAHLQAKTLLKRVAFAGMTLDLQRDEKEKGTLWETEMSRTRWSMTENLDTIVEGWAETNRMAKALRWVLFIKFAVKRIQDYRLYKVLKLENLYYERHFLLTS